MSTPAPLLKLRPDLQFSPHSYGGQPCYLLEDPFNAAYFRLGVAEYQILQHLNGTTAFADLAADPECSLTAEQLHVLAHWLVQNRLAYVQTEQGWQLAEAKPDKAQQIARYFNLLFIRLPLGSPDRIINRLFPYLRPLLGWRFFSLWLIIGLTGAWQIATQFESFIQAADSVLAVNNMLWLLLAWLVVKTVHELFHGLVCKRYGGYIHQAGIMLILFAPIGGYVNATSSWRFTSRWQRIHVSIAGMYIELFLAGVAAWIWAYTAPGELNLFAYNVVLISSIATLLFNANPLMRFDGYYVLTDLINIPNLYTLGQKYIQYLNQRYLQGRKVLDPVAGQRRAWFIRLYGVTALLWRWLVMITLIILAHLLWHGAGVVLAIIAVLIMFVLPLLRFLLHLHSHPQRGAIMRRLVLLLGVGGGLILLLLQQVQWSPRLTVPAVVDYAKDSVIRADSPGFIAQVAVQPGQTVQAGDLLLVLYNPTLVAERDDLALQVQIQTLKQQQYLTAEQLSAYQAEAEKLHALQQKWRELNQQVARLNLYAPHAGTVITTDLKAWLGRYVERGTELLTLADTSQLQLKASIAQQEIDDFRAQIGATVQVYRDSQPLRALPAILTQVEPSASEQIRYPALTALGGGALAVRRRSEPLSEEAGQDELSAGYAHLQPRFTATVQLTGAIADGLAAGETAQVVLSRPARSVWYSLRLGVSQYLEGIKAQGEAAMR